MTIDFEKTEERELEFSSLHAKGNGVGAMMNMQTSFTLEPLDDGTKMLWAADVSIAGPGRRDGAAGPAADRQAAGEPGARRRSTSRCCRGERGERRAVRRRSSSRRWQRRSASG